MHRGQSRKRPRDAGSSLAAAAAARLAGRKARLRPGPPGIRAFAGVPMLPSQASSWYRRMSVVYAIGTWTLLGSMFIMSRKDGKPPGDEVEQKDVSTNELLEPPKGFYMETIVTYREDFVPVTEKILNYWKSWTGGPGPES